MKATTEAAEPELVGLIASPAANAAAGGLALTILFARTLDLARTDPGPLARGIHTDRR